MPETLFSPRITMDDEFDIYGDLEGFEVEAQKETKVIKELKAEIEDLKARIAEKESEKESIASKNEILLENISSLLLTAKAELKRKDSLIADIRRQMDNNAFRRDKRNVRKHDQGTQTTLIRMLSREVQVDSGGTITEEEEPRRVKAGREKRKERSPLKKARKERGKSLERMKPARLVDLRDRIREKLSKERTTADNSRRRERTPQWNASRERFREREREREKERRARHRTPEISAVRFSHPLRVSRQPGHHGKTDSSSSDTKLAQTFIPMNRKELDQYVKEIARKENRSPDEDSPERGRNRKDKLNAGLKDRKKEPAVPAKVVEEKIIQSDEIGTTLSPGSVEDVEQTMRVLHGEPTRPVQASTPECRLQTTNELLEGLKKTPQPPPPLVIPPPEPPIIEQVPEVPFEDDPRLNDSRELRIVESGETVAEEAEVGRLAGETVGVERTDELEDGEIASSDGDLAKEEDNDPGGFPRTVSDRTERKHKEGTKQKGKKEAKILLDKLDDSVERKHDRRDRKIERTESKRKEVPKQESKREARILLDKLDDSVVRRHSLETEHSRKDGEGKSKRNRGVSFDTSTPVRTSRRDSEREQPTVVAEKPKSKTRRLSEQAKPKEKASATEEPQGKLKKEKLKELFGTDDENSRCEPPPTTGKRKLSVGREESSKDNKKQRRSKGKDSKDEGKFTKLIMAPCEVVEEQTEIRSTEAFDEDPLPKEATPEEVPFNAPCQEEPQITDDCVESLMDDQLPMKASVENTSTPSALLPEQPSEEHSPQKDPVETSHHDASMEETSANLPSEEQPSPSASSGAVPMETKQPDQPTTEVNIPQEDQPSLRATEEVLVETQQEDTGMLEVTIQTSQNDQLPMDASVENTSPSNASLPEPPSVEVPPQKDPVATCHHDVSMEEIPANSPQHTEELPTETQQQDQLTTELHSVDTAQNGLPPMDPPLPKTPTKPPHQTSQLRSPEVVVFSNKYGEYRVEDISETETTIYVTRKKKKKRKSGRADVSTG